jgi:hypothetical protein
MILPASLAEHPAHPKGTRSMKKALIIATVAVLALGGSAVAYHAYAHQGSWGYGRWHRQMSASDMSAFADARIAALKAGLALSAEQEKLWPPVESTLRELAKKRIDRREQFRAEREQRATSGELPNPIDRLRRGADRLSEGGADLKRLADTTEPLYKTLDDAQKRRFNMLARAGMRGMQHGGPGWHRHGDMGDEGRHMGPNMGPRDRDRGGMGWRRTDMDDDAPDAERL